ncbi:unnamed protein product [Cylindrotheca closterium]|uniref:Uncharacterized protein n=1 Tax=Cylindrotheca closterium TaxID=2856 RepID=A0AAD2FWV1_9STRA|nr:unnamed protein product [Cylindrotheca closterium]
MTSDNKTIAGGSKKRPVSGASDNKNNDQSSLKQSKLSCPPADDKTLGNCIETIKDEKECFHERVTDDEKETFKYMMIKTLGQNEDFFKPTQSILMVDLAHFLKTGETEVIVAGTEATALQRVASIEFDINASKMVYKRDLTAFVDEVKNLFDWLEKGSKVYMAPCFPLLQSSGAGKTKLLHKSRCSMAKNDPDVHMKLICTNGKSPPEMSSQNGSIFSKTLDVSQFQVDEEGQKKLWEKMVALVKTEKEKKKKVVFLFDESQHLTSSCDGWHFRCIRWWLRLVCIFVCVPTTTSLKYGGPLFGRLQLNGKLKDALGHILLRIRGAGQELSLQKYYSLLATRLQMGQVLLDFASELVALGYAHLTHYSQEQTAVAEIAFGNLYEYVDGISLGCGKPPSVWSEKAIKIYSSALCRPKKGDVGEVAAAFYMLACGDELRFEHSRDLTQLSVPRENWIARMQQSKGAKLCKSTAKPSVNFIQVCRNYLRYSLKEIEDSRLL